MNEVMIIDGERIGTDAENAADRGEGRGRDQEISETVRVHFYQLGGLMNIGILIFLCAVILGVPTVRDIIREGL